MRMLCMNGQRKLNDLEEIIDSVVPVAQDIFDHWNYETDDHAIFRSAEKMVLDAIDESADIETFICEIERTVARVINQNATTE